MKTLIFTSLLALHVFSLKAQQEGCFSRFLEEGAAATESGRYKEALDRYEAANMCIDKKPEDQRMVDSLMENSKSQLDSALAAAIVLNKINTIVSNALKLSSQNPTLALRLAHEACNLSKNKIDLAVETRQSILNNPFYAYCARTVQAGCEVTDLAVAPDGNYIYVGCFRGGIKIYDIEMDNLTELALPSTDAGMYSLTLSPNGDRLLAGYDDGSLRLFDTQGILLSEGTIPSDKRITGAAFSPSGDTIAVTSLSGHLVVWNSNDISLEPNTTKVFPDALNGIAFLPDGKRVIVASRDFTNKIIDLRTLREEILSGHTQLSYSVGVSHDGKWIASTSNDKTLRLWAAESPKALRSFTGHTEYVRNLAFAHDNRHVVSTDLDGVGRLWDLNGNCIKELRGHEDEVWAVAFAPDDSYIVTGSLDETIRLWRNPLRDPFADMPHGDAIISATTSPDGFYILTGSLDKTAKLWDRETREVIWTYTAPDQIVSCTVSPDGRYALLGVWNGEAHLLDLSTGVLLRIFQGHASSLYAVAFSTDSKKIETCSRDNTAKCWTLDGIQISTVSHTDRVSAVAFSPDDKKMASGSWDKTVKISSLPGGKNVKTVVVPGAVSALSFHPDGKKILVSGEDGLCRLIDLNGKTLMDFKHPKDAYQIYSSAFSFSGDTIFTGADDGRIRSFLLDGSPLKEVHGHTGTVYSVRPVPNTNMLLSAGKEGRARLWRASALTSVRVFRGHVTDIDWAKINSEGAEVLTGRDDGQFKYWSRFDYDGATLTNKPAQRVTAFATPSAGDMRMIYGGQPDGSIVRWDKTRSSQAPVRFAKLSGRVNSLDCTTNDTLLVAGTNDSLAYILDNRGKILAKRKFRNAITTVNISGDGSYVLVAHQGTNKYSHSVKFWDWKRDSILWERISFNPIATVAFSQDNSICAVASTGTTLGGTTLYRKDGQFIKRMFEDKGHATSISFSRNGRYMLTVNTAGEATVWDGTDEFNAEFPLLNLSLPNGDTIVEAGFASYPEEQTSPREIMLCGKRSGPVFYPFSLTGLEGKNSDIEKLTAEQRAQYEIDFDFESCFASDNLEEVSDCAEYFRNSYLDDYNDKAFALAEKLFWRLINESLQENARERLADLYQTKINRIEDAGRPDRYSEIIQYSGSMVALARQDSLDYPDLSEKMDALFSAYWNHSWYLMLAGKFQESLQAAEQGLAVPSDNEQKNGIASNKALALLLTAPSYEVAKRYYDEWKDRAWVDYRHPKFRGAFLDDFESLRKEGVYETLDAKQKERIRQMEAQLKEEEAAKKEGNGN